MVVPPAPVALLPAVPVPTVLPVPVLPAVPLPELAPDPVVGPRLGLPGNGSMWCVPTSTMNWLAYIAAHGFGSVPPGIADWEGDPLDFTTYNLMAEHLGTLGALMLTDAEAESMLAVILPVPVTRTSRPPWMPDASTSAFENARLGLTLDLQRELLETGWRQPK